MIRLLVLFLLSMCVAAVPTGEDAPVKWTADEQALVNLTNAERKKVGLAALKPHPKLMVAARQHAANMAKQNKMDHELDGKNVMDRIKELGYTMGRVGENIAWNRPDPKSALATWMNSEGHKANILMADFQDIGVAVARNTQGQKFWVQVFAKPLR